MSNETNKRRHGCLFYGCLTGTVCLLAILVAALLGLHQVKKMVTEYTDTNPVPLPAVTLSAAQIEQLERRIEAFQDTVRAGRPAQPLVLTGEELNALVASRPDLRRFKDKVYISIPDSQLAGQISIPMSELGLPFFRNRYLNGSTTFSVSLQNGKLRVVPDNILVKGKPLPRVYMEQIRQQNLAASAEDNPRVSVALDRLQDIQVKDGKLIIVPKNE